MILLTKLNGDEIALNTSLIIRVEQRGDTVVFLTDGNDFLVQERLDEVVARIRRAHASVLAEAFLMTDEIRDAEAGASAGADAAEGEAQ